MKTLILILLANVLQLAVISASSEDDIVVYRFFDPSYTGDGHIHVIRMPRSEVLKRAEQNPQGREFDMNVAASVEKVHEFLKKKYSDSQDFKVYSGTLSWRVLENSNNQFVGIQFCFVRSEIRIPWDTPNGLRILPCYHLVLRDGTVLESPGPEYELKKDPQQD